MPVELNSSEFNKIVSTAARFSAARSPVDNYKCVHLWTEQGMLIAECLCSEGRVTVAAECEGKLEPSTVDARKLVVASGFAKGGACKVSKTSNRLSLSYEGGKAQLPVFTDTWPEREVFSESKGGAIVASGDLKRCFNQVSSVSSKMEQKYAQEFRLYTEGTNLCVTGSTGATFGGAWCPNREGEIDARIPSIAAQKVSQCLDDESVLAVMDTGHRVVLTSDTLVASLIKSGSEGKAPERLSNMSHHWKSANAWKNVDLAGLRQFLSEARHFTTEECSGITLGPCGDTIECSFDGMAMGTHSADYDVLESCSRSVKGEGSGESILVLHRKLAPIVGAMNGTSIEIRTIPHAIFLLSESFVAGVGRAARRS